MTIKVFEAFAGIGSQAMALRNIGLDFEVVGISEVDRYGLIAYDAIHSNGEEVELKSKEEMLEEISKRNIAYNFSTGKSEIPKNEEEIRKLYEAHIRSKNYGDITKIEPSELPDFDLFTYSFPCKNISVAGKQAGLAEGSGTQSSLVWECRDIIKTKKPKYLLMENVKNLVGSKHKPFFDLWCEELEDMGYTNYWKVLNGKNFGVPQNRERVMMISILNDDEQTYSLPTKSSRPSKCIADIMESSVDAKFYMDKEFEFTDKFYQEESRSNKIIEVARTDSTYDEGARIYSMYGISPTIAARDWKGAKKVLIEVAKLKSSGLRSNKAVYHEEGICPTLTSMNGGNRQPKIITNDNIPSNIFTKDGYAIRKLTPLECWRIMGFSDEDYQKAKESGLSSTKLYERAGRGIVVPMLEEIFKELFKEELSK